MDDITVARKLISKYDNAASRGIECSLSFSRMKAMMKTKRCKYTGLTMTRPIRGQDKRLTDRTIERIDATRGYTDDNCIAVCHMANKIKAIAEQTNNTITMQHLIRLGVSLSKL